MNVEIMDHTGKGTGDPWHAAALMIWTKRTRIEMSPGGLREILDWPEARKVEELGYMARTIPSSWEFCDAVFLITGVTRAFTHQLVRTRQASYAQQTMQILDVSGGWEARCGPTITGNPERENTYRTTLDVIAASYRFLVTDGAKIEDARGILPTNILTNIVCKMNLRTLCSLFRARRSARNTGEFPEVVAAMEAALLAVFPWAEIFLRRSADVAAGELNALIERSVPDADARRDMIKLVDQILSFEGSDL